MIPQKKALFVFPVGGRGDFLSSILYGNKLKQSFDLDEVLFPADNTSFLMKTHGWTNCEYSGVPITPETLNQITATKWLIVAPSFQEEIDVAYLNWHKKFKVENEPISLQQLSSLIHLTRRFNEQVNDYKNQFDYVINFKDIFEIEFIEQLYQKINDQKLNDKELYHIKYNIDHNIQILKTCPFKFNSWDNFIETLSKDLVA